MVVGEKDIVQRLKTKDLAAYSELYDKTAPSLFRIIFKLIADTETANRILQQVFIHCWHNIYLFDTSKEKLLVWMVRIAIKQSKETLNVPNRDLIKAA